MRRHFGGKGGRSKCVPGSEVMCESLLERVGCEKVINLGTQEVKNQHGTSEVSKGTLGRLRQSEDGGFTPRALAPAACALQGSLWLPGMDKELEEGSTLRG